MTGALGHFTAVRDAIGDRGPSRILADALKALPPDYAEEEIDRRVDDTLRDLGLEGVRNLQIGKPEKKVLSAGRLPA